MAVARGAGLDYDGAVYLERGLYHAEQVAQKHSFSLIRLPWSLMFEAPKPPLYHGLLAGIALVAGRSHLSAIVFVAVCASVLLLALGVWALGRDGESSRAGLFAVGMLFAMPLVLRMSGRLMVETMLTALVTIGVLFGLRAARDESRAADRVGVGAAIGLAALTKLPGPLFLLPSLVQAATAVLRRQGLRKAVLSLFAVIGMAVLLAGPWYLRNGRAAVDFGTFSANSWAHEDSGSSSTRPFRLLLVAFGWPLGAALLALGIGGARVWRERDRAWRELTLVTLAVAALAGGMVVAARQFDPRFWMPCLGLVAAWAGRELDFWADSRRRIAVAGIGVVALVAVAASGELRAASAATPWRLATYLNAHAPRRTPGALLCNLGESPAWNRYKLRLMAQVSSIRPRMMVLDLLHEAPAGELAKSLQLCDLVFLLDPGEIPRDRPQIRQNERLMEARTEFRRQATGFERDLPAEATLAEVATVEVFSRRGPCPAGGLEP